VDKTTNIKKEEERKITPTKKTSTKPVATKRAATKKATSKKATSKKATSKKAATKKQANPKPTSGNGNPPKEESLDSKEIRKPSEKEKVEKVKNNKEVSVKKFEPPSQTLNLLDYFDKVYCINLDSRPERWELFEKRMHENGLEGCVRFQAVDGNKCPAPAWWRSGDGAWGCMSSHLRICQNALMEGLENYLVFEDDVVFRKDFIFHFSQIMKEISTLNNNWDMFYLGGQHLYVESARPYPFKTPNLLKCYNINRTHAFALNKRVMRKFSQHIVHAPDYINWQGDPAWPPHIDHQLGILHPQIVTIAAKDWLCGQSAGTSNVSNQQLPEHWWHDKGWNS